MHSVQVNWEDEENNRIVELAVKYRAESGAITFEHITPTRVAFLCPETQNELRSIGVHRQSSRVMLAEKFTAGGGLSDLERRLFEEHASNIQA